MPKGMGYPKKPKPAKRRNPRNLKARSTPQPKQRKKVGGKRRKS